MPKIQRSILSMCGYTDHSSSYIRVKLSTHNLFSNLDTAGDRKLRFKDKLNLDMYLHLHCMCTDYLYGEGTSLENDQ